MKVLPVSPLPQEDSDDDVHETPKERRSRLKHDPNFQRWVDHMVDKRIKERERVSAKWRSGSKHRRRLLGRSSRCNDHSSSRSRMKSRSRSKGTPSQGRQGMKVVTEGHEPVKSPSDTKIYMPALQHNLEKQDAVAKISNFVEGLRLSSQRRRSQTRSPTPTRSHAQSRHCSDSRSSRERSVQRRRHSQTRSHSPQRDRKKTLAPARNLADKVITDAEQFKANLIPPKGKSSPEVLGSTVNFIDTDDEFFHITCHIEPNLREKIERGDYIELERLLPMEGNKVGSGEEERPIRLFERNGETYVAPSSKVNSKIASVHKWDQAFRIYAAIYSKAQPARAVEISQYVHMIHTAASSFIWSNVAYYDQTFRQLMTHNPARSRAKTYTQGWHLAMTDPIGTRPQVNDSSTRVLGSSTGADWRDECCWHFNGNRCRMGASDCKFNHQCTYCGGWNHGSYNCKRRMAKREGRHDTKSGTSNGNPRTSPPRKLHPRWEEITA